MHFFSLFVVGDAPTYVNGQLIVEETVLHHVSDMNCDLIWSIFSCYFNPSSLFCLQADRVVIGGDHFFRYWTFPAFLLLPFSFSLVLMGTNE